MRLNFLNLNNNHICFYKFNIIEPGQMTQLVKELAMQALASEWNPEHPHKKSCMIVCGFWKHSGQPAWLNGDPANQ